MELHKNTQYIVRQWLGGLWQRFTGGIGGQLVLAFSGIHFIWLLLCHISYYYVGDILKIGMLALLVLLGNLPTLLGFWHVVPRWLREFAALQSCVTFLNAITLCANGFVSTFTDIEVYILGLLIILMFCYSTRSVLGMLMYEISITMAYMVDALMFGQIYVILLLLVLPFGVMIYRQRGQTKSFHLYLVYTAVVWLLYLWFHQESSSFGIWIYVMYAYFVALYLLDMRLNDREKPYYRRPLRLLSYGGMCVVFTKASLGGAWATRTNSPSIYGIHVLLFVLMVVICLFYVERILRSHITLEELAVYLLYFISFAVYIYYEFYTSGSGQVMEWYFMGCMLLMVLTTMVKMSKYHSVMLGLVPWAMLGAYVYLVVSRAQRLNEVVAATCMLVLVLTGLGALTRPAERGK